MSKADARHDPGVAGESAAQAGDAPHAAGIATDVRLRVLIVAGVLALVHVALALVWPRLTDSPVNPVLHLAWFVADLFVVGSILLISPAARTWPAYAAGYAAIVWLLWPMIRLMPENLVLLVLALMVYGGLARHPWLSGYLLLFLVAQRFAPAYLFPAFLLGALLYTTLPPFVTLWRGKQRMLPLMQLAGLALLLALLLPVLFYVSQTSSQTLQQRLREPEVAMALQVTLRTSLVATLVVLLLGVPLAYCLVRVSFPARGLIHTLVDLPVVVPPPVAGLLLLAFVGPKAPAGEFLEQRGLRCFDAEWGIILAQIFVSSPFLIRASMVAFAAIDPRLEKVARTLGAGNGSTFVRVTLPLAWRGILIGAGLTWFRAMAEFGSLKILANRPRTMPILAYENFLEFGQAEARSIAALILIMCLGVMVGMWLLRAMPGLVRAGGGDAAG